MVANHRSPVSGGTKLPIRRSTSLTVRLSFARGEKVCRAALRNGFEQRCLFSVTLDVHFVSCKLQVTYEKLANKRLEKTAIANREKIQGEKERERERADSAPITLIDN